MALFGTKSKPVLKTSGRKESSPKTKKGDIGFKLKNDNDLGFELKEERKKKKGFF